MHRLGTVRRLEGLSRRAAAKRLNMDLERLEFQERETSDILLSELYDFQDVLSVPVAELVAEPGEMLPKTTRRRAQLVRVMKTVVAIMEEAKQPSVRRLAQTLIDRLTEIMPELRAVSSWHSDDVHPTHNDLGAAAERLLPKDDPDR